jgi:hypothetical protein
MKNPSYVPSYFIMNQVYMAYVSIFYVGEPVLLDVETSLLHVNTLFCKLCILLCDF